jgi:LAS superfamily LD-carboxypeptidase LdcB
LIRVRRVVVGVFVGVFFAVWLVGCAAEAASPPPEGGSDGSIPRGERISPFDTGHAAVANLDAELLDAVRAAAEDAGADGIEIGVTSGWRSKAYQQRLLDEAVLDRGSLREALRFVSTPEDSEHVTGDAVDIGPTDAADWLIRHGADYGLCQVYANEMWHFELRTPPGGECPQPRADATS